MANNQQLLLGEGAGGGIPNYIEEVFNTFVWTGTGSSQTLTTGVDTATHGGLFWTKNRTNVFDHALWSTNFSLAGNYLLKSNTTGALTYGTYGTGDYVSNSTTGVTVYGNSQNYVTWTFRKQPKFFDVVTYTGTGSNTTIAHTLGAVPGCIIVKRTDTTADWAVYHRSLANTQYLVLDTTAAAATGATWWNSTTPTSSVFSIGTDASVNASGGTYVAYIFAHDAGGFGLAGTDNVISCGSYTDTGSGTQTITLGYEPQWVMRKRTNSADNWTIVDNMRGLTSYSSAAGLNANSSGAEFNFNSAGITATGFEWATSGSADTFIYIAIRRGPMKVPTVGTSVFSPQALNAPANGTQVTTGFPIDLSMFKPRDGGPSGQFQDRLRGLPSTAGGGTPALYPDATAAESTNQTGYEFWNTGYRTYTSQNAVWWMLRRAPGFFDEVCYTGTYLAPQSHNLGVAPELVIFKNRTTGSMNWIVKSYSILGNSQALVLNSTAAAGIPSGLPTPPFASNPDSATTFYSQNTGVQEYNYATDNYVAYLFATCAGVSKVGSYTGNGSSQTIACGFTAGSRFVMIKRTDSTGDWYVWDSARGIVAGNDPHLSLNTTAAEVTTDDSVDTDNSGFIVNQLAATNVNVTSATYIFLAIS